MIRIVTTAATLVCFISAAAFLSPVSVSPALAQSCKNQAMGKDGKALAGAAKTSAIKKCCEASAVREAGGGFPIPTKGKPPRRRRLRWLRDIFLDDAATPYSF